MFRNTRISTRMALGFVAVLGLLATLTVIGVFQVGRISARLKEIGDDAGMMQRYGINMRGSVHDRSIGVRDVVLINEVGELNAVIADIGRLAKFYAESSEALDKMIATEAGVTQDERDLVKAIKETEAKALPIIKSVIDEKSNGDAYNSREIVIEKARPVFTTWLAQINKFIDIQEQQVQAAATEARVTAERFAMLMIGLTVIAVMIGVAFALWNILSIRPLKDLTATMSRLAQGDLSAEIRVDGSRNEVGQITRAAQAFKDHVTEKAREEAEAALVRQQEDTDRQAKAARVEADAQEKVHAQQRRAAEEQAQVMQALGEGLRSLSAGDLTFRLSAQVPADYEPIKADFNAMVERIAEAMAAITASTREVSNASGEISASTTDLSQRTEEQAASLEQTSASMEEIAATVRKNAENAQTANQSANGAREVAERGGAVVATAVDAMARIEESSRKISDIIGVIDEIARQTNLLALNAAVEAARAGEAGRGFAVVASEVRSLAQRSSQAAKDIKELIVSSGGQVKDGVNLVNRAGAALSEIMESIKGVTAIVADIASASAEQSIGIAEVNKALQQMDEATQQNSALVEENAATAKTLESQAQAMNERVSYFRVESVARPSAAPAQKRSPAQAKAAPAARPAAASRGPVARMQASVATAFANEADWQEF
ncbi:methyl-accepting chemotaxis protein [Terrarubrum flagellatum]|uniref:methyl-accepting chemotaxis protein n=1 Tax=Terrirubrum flagellatum TaxID=2895980 RepID=UPI0031451499